MFNRIFSNGRKSGDITNDAETFDVRKKKMDRDTVFLDVHSDAFLKEIMDKARRLYFNMHELTQTQPDGSLSTLLLEKGMQKYVEFADSLNSDSITVEKVTRDALALVKGMTAIMRSVTFLEEQNLNVPVSHQDQRDTMVHEFDVDRYEKDQDALKRGQNQLQNLRRRGSGVV